MPFRSLGLGDRILTAIQEAGYTEPTPIQAAAIPPVLAGHDLIGIAQTGTGKTAAFTLPMLMKLSDGAAATQRGTRALVLAPTRELVVQIDENVRAYGRYVPLRIATVFGGVGEQPQIKALRSDVDLVIATPGRLLDLLGRGHGNFSRLQFLVLDEADRMLDMGFLPDIRRIVGGLPKQRQTLLFSATLSKEIESVTREFQRSPKIIQIGRRSNPAETVTQLVYEVPMHLKPALLVHLLQSPDYNTVLVFTRTKHGADKVARKLEQAGIRCGTLHSNRSQNQRLKALNDFKEGTVRVLVATDIAARGIDVDGISHVVNYDFPMHSEDYVHRIGRTGRAQAVGDAISFVTPEDHGPLRSLERFIGRGIVRKQASGFNYQAAPQPRQDDGSRPARHGGGGHRPQQSSRPRPAGGGGGGGGGGSRRPMSGSWRPRGR
jgi:ATP-dependent RNA helicase RhlE